jgi:PilZ domain
MDFPPESANAGARFAERRAWPRYALIAVVQIVEPVAGIQLSGRTAEISFGGCYVDILNTLPKGTVIQLSIQRDQGAFQTWGCVAYAHPGIGIGVRFFDTAPEDAAVLKIWIDELSASVWNAI